jgi:Meiotically Up-regulated Gene 113 (MUG113) protein
VGEKQQKLLAHVVELERRLAEAQANKERAVARAQLTRSGHVYVISNIGSFGEEVFKIGMTRRLDPLERIRELGDASVPFAFDIHAVIFSEDAPTLEATLHREFDGRRVNLVNERKEFFGVSIQDIAQAVRKCHGEIQMTLAAEAKDYRKTVSMRAANQQPIPGDRRITDPPPLQRSDEIGQARSAGP